MPEKVRRTPGQVPPIKRVKPRKQQPIKYYAAGTGASTTAKPADRLAQVRLRADEAASLGYSMQVLQIGSTSEALREALRLLHREAAESEAASNIRAYYQGEPAPLPDGVMPVEEEDLLAADNAEW
jgi:hypothetical protein